VLRVDPTNRCAVLLAYDRKLVVIPFRPELAVSDPYELIDDFRPLPASYALDLRDLNVVHVKDYIFLEGYSQPTLMILFEQEPSWAGRAAYRRNVDCIAVLSLDSTLRVSPLIWAADRLPYDCERLLAVPEQLGGALVLSINALLYVNQSVRVAWKLNELAVVDESRFSVGAHTGDALTLAGAHGAFVASNTALLSLHDGTLLVAHLLHANRAVRAFALRRQGRAAPSLVSVLSRRYLFLGSRCARARDRACVVVNRVCVDWPTLCC
jgi:cleavage and polyadenylation specificity factor subunit 1